MATATVHVPDVGGYSGQARCYRLDPPRDFDGQTSEFVTIVIQPRLAHQDAEVKVYPAKESGASAVLQLRRRVGSFTVAGDVDSDHYREGCYGLALQLLGGYTVQAA